MGQGVLIIQKYWGEKKVKKDGDALVFGGQKGETEAGKVNELSRIAVTHSFSLLSPSFSSKSK